MPAARAISVSGLFVYPIKSARGIPVAEARVTDRGFLHDRRFMVVDAAGEFITQRQRPELALVEVRIERDSLEIQAPGAGRIAVPLRPDGGERRRVRVWGDRCDARSLGDEPRRFFERALGAPCELVYMPDETIRPADPAYAPGGEPVSFADGFPFLVVSQASLDDLNRRLAQPVPMNRFRPNIVLEGCEPFEEDALGAFTLGDVVFQPAKPCARCAIVTVDQATGVPGKEPLVTLARFRAAGNKVLFGQNLLHRGQGAVRVGDRLRPMA